MVREKRKWRSHERESTDAEHSGGPTRSSVEISVMEAERRGWLIRLYDQVNQKWEELGHKVKLLAYISHQLDERSRVNREIHARICGSVGVKFPCATRLSGRHIPVIDSFPRCNLH